MAQGPEVQNIHATCIAAYGKGLIILGPSGAGKSALALQMIALGAQLVADDRCEVWAKDGRLFARASTALSGMIEARGIGVLRLPFLPQIQVQAAIDLSTSPAARLPERRHSTLAGVLVEFLHFHPASHFPSALMCYLMGTRVE